MEGGWYDDGEDRKVAREVKMMSVPYAGDEQSNVSPTAVLLDLTLGASVQHLLHQASDPTVAKLDSDGPDVKVSVSMWEDE